MLAGIQNKVKESLKAIINEDAAISQVHSVAGGSINDCYSFNYGKHKLFVKLNNAAKFPGMFEAEVKGLKLLQEKSVLVLPEVICTGNDKGIQFLVLRFLESAEESWLYWETLGKKLAELHQVSDKYFGLDHDNYIGSLRQTNARFMEHNEFYISCRVEPLLKMAIDAQKLDRIIVRNFERFFSLLNEIISPEPPALLHGDLWSGNVMSSQNGPAVYDPAVYFGHRETDIAMSHMFGAFHPVFYETYNAFFPLQKGWERRMDVFQLYPLLVHVNLFGGSYSREVKSWISRY